MDDKEKSEQVEKPENGKSKINRIGQAGRDGMTGDRKAWPEKIALALQPFGTEKQGLWFTHSAIHKRLVECGYTGAPLRLSIILRAMVKDGYLERADKPDQLKAKYRAIPEYIYRRTSKPYKAKSMGKGMNGNPSAAMQKAWKIKMDHPSLPKWFGDMMT